MLCNRRFIIQLLCLFLAACPQAPPPAGQRTVPTVTAGPPGPNPADVVIPQGFRIEVAAQGLTRPVAVTVDEEGRAYVIESGGDGAMPRLMLIEPGGGLTEIARGEPGAVWTGMTNSAGVFFITEGGPGENGRLSRLADGKNETVAEDLPNGDHGAASPIIGPDGWLYFAQGSVTNAGVVGPDNGWRARQPNRHDIPCQDIALTGAVFTADGKTTGAFSRFGTVAGAKVTGKIPCSGAVLRVPPMGGKPQLVAWGLRNPQALAFAADGRLFAADRGYEMRGSRSTAPGQDLLWEITSGVWYGWPDFSGQTPVYDGSVPRLLADPPNPPPAPRALLGEKAAPAGLDLARDETFGGMDQAYLALAASVVRINVATGAIADFATSKGKGEGGLKHPVALRFSPDGGALYIVDAGAVNGEGVVWRIVKM